MEVLVGLDVGSTTAKIVVLNLNRELLYKAYRRHFSDIRNTTLRLLESVRAKFPDAEIKMNVSGSSGLGIGEKAGIPFIQEVIACTEAVRSHRPNIDVIVELGGEDAKIIYLTNGLEQRMNSACAGGTGAFIDQIASLLNTDAAGLNELARKAEKIYPIASRCGVFAKTDIQPLLNEGVRKEDIAASVFQAVVNQTIGGLACGRPIRGNVALLGGPLTFLDQLRERFIKTLNLADEQAVYSENGHFAVAIGAALQSEKNETVDIDETIRLIREMNQEKVQDGSKKNPVLFHSEKEYIAFQKRHQQARVKRGDLQTYRGPAFLGIDAGSTTTKLVLIGENEEVLYSFYEKNRGNPLETVRNALMDLYQKLPPSVHIKRSTVTGYGEKLIRAAFQADDGEVETVAHYTAAKKFQPDVDFILDIGGQDMKCIKIKNGVIDQIILNEACSAGCGSFLENFAETLGFSVQQFSQLALFSQNPVELGSRCTVFMNSRVKQVQKEGAGIAEISAGLAYSVVLNALYKVIKLKTAEDLGEKIVVQGGTFLNDAVLRAFENLIGKEVIRPDLAGLMGAYGSAILARRKWREGDETTLLPPEKLLDFRVKTSYSRCGRCENHCPLTISKFPGRRIFITGNRCERGAGKQPVHSDLPNFAQEKLERLFNRESLSRQRAQRGQIGIPRVLNMYENYPFWHRFFTELGYEVVLSDPTNKETLARGIETIPSEAVCYPAKLVHGHIFNLIDKGVRTIFYPSVVYEKKESEAQQNHFNCPVVASYPEVIRINMQPVFAEYGVAFLNPFLTLENLTALTRELYHAFPDIPKQELKQALLKARMEEREYKQWVRKRGEEILSWIGQNQKKAIVIAGHPYHIDPMINHGLPEEIIRLGFAVLTEDAICHLAKNEKHPDVVNQWTYHSRLYRAADVVKNNSNLELLQITSFGCGLDAITTDAVKEILEEHGQLYTWMKMDEISNLGSARIRLRSLKAAVEEREQKPVQAQPRRAKPAPIFTKKSKKEYTILAPQMSPTHFALLEKAFQLDGYKLKVLDRTKMEDEETGLRYVNNDACYPAIITIGQLVHELQQGDYDLNRTAVIISQTGGGCRATNYYALLKKAMKGAGMPQVPVLSLNINQMSKQTQPGFTFSLQLARNLVVAACLGDLLERLRLATRPYERIKGSTEKLYDQWIRRCRELLTNFSIKRYRQIIAQMIREFSAIEIVPETKPRIGVVGEILVKFHPYANNEIVRTIEEEGGEAVVPDFVDFFLYSLYNQDFKARHLGRPKINAVLGKIAIRLIEIYREPIRQALLSGHRFGAPLAIEEVAEKAARFINIGNEMGEGWLLPGEIGELMDSGVYNVVCVQPFGCLPNHVIARGTFNAIKRQYPKANIIAIDFDASISKVNQLNRMKLMINIAKNNLARA